MEENEQAIRLERDVLPEEKINCVAVRVKKKIYK
jgi:hypothetical protein